MTVKMTKKEALEMAATLWDYLVEHPGDTKGQASKALNLPYLENGCPCCEYAKQHSSYEWLDCTLCPLAEVFGVEEDGDYACENYYDSPYLEWLDGCETAAKEIADAAKVALLELGGEEKADQKLVDL